MPYKDRKAKNAAHKRRRDELRAAAVTALGGSCETCGFDDVIALDIVRMLGPDGQPIVEGAGSVLHRRVIAGDRKGVRLECVRCHAIEIRSAGHLHRNHGTPPEPARRPATPAARALAKEMR